MIQIYIQADVCFQSAKHWIWYTRSLAYHPRQFIVHCFLLHFHVVPKFQVTNTACKQAAYGPSVDYFFERLIQFFELFANYVWTI